MTDNDAALVNEKPDAGNDGVGTVTVLIAAYNAAPFLHRAVYSALDQTYPPLEIIIVDDGSTDNTLVVAQSLAEANPAIRVIALPENGGPAIARNAGLDLARGDWIAILDADDAFLPNRLERLIDTGNAMNADIVADNFLWYDAKADVVGTPGIVASPATETIDIYRFTAQAMPFTHEMDWGLLKPIFRRRFLDEHNLRYPLYSRHGEDFLLMLSTFLAGARYELVRTPGYLYTHRYAGLSRTRIDYDSMAIHTADLLKQDRVRTDDRLKQLLKERIHAQKRLSAEHELRQLIDRRDFVKISRAALTDARFFRAILRFGWRKTKNLKPVRNTALAAASYGSRFLMRLPLSSTFKLKALEPFIWRKLSWRPDTFRVRTRFGAKIQCVLADFIQYKIFYFGIWEPNLTAFLQSRLRPGDGFVDVGANIGYYSLLASKCVGKKGRVIAIEASPKIFADLQKNLEANRCRNVRTVNVAISDRKGILQLFSGTPDNTGRTTILESRGLEFEAEVPADRLENVLLPEEISTARLIKIDVEGAEAPILDTILENLEHYHRDVEIVVEINPPEVLEHGTTARKIIERFAEACFHAYHLPNDYSTAAYISNQPVSRPKKLSSPPEKLADVVFSRIDADEL